MAIKGIKVLLAGVLVGCAPAVPGGASTAPGPDVRLNAPQGSEVLSIGATVVRGVANLQDPIDKVWAALPVAYDSLAIPLTVLDATNHVIGNEGLKLRRRLGRVRLSEFLNCGNGEGGPSADSYDVNLSVVTKLQPNSNGGTTATITVDGVAKPAEFSGDYIKCATTGALETRLVKLVQPQLQ